MTHTLRGIGQLIALVPYQLGFVPSGSFVLALFRDRTLLATLRFDADGGVARSVHTALEAYGRVGADDAVLIGYRLEPGADLRSMAAALTSVGIRLGHVLVAAGDGWWATQCRPGCCDGALHEVVPPYEVSAVAELIGQGVSPLATRDDLRVQFTRVDMGAQAAVADAIAGLGPVHRERAWGSWCDVVRGRPVPDVGFGELLAVLSDATFRDGVVADVVPELLVEMALSPLSRREDRGEPSSSSASRAHALTAALPRVPEVHRSRWLSLVALAYWRDGQQVLAGVASEVAAELDPALPLTALVRRLLALGRPYGDLVGSRERCA